MPRLVCRQHHARPASLSVRLAFIIAEAEAAAGLYEYMAREKNTSVVMFPLADGTFWLRLSAQVGAEHTLPTTSIHTFRARGPHLRARLPPPDLRRPTRHSTLRGTNHRVPRHAKRTVSRRCAAVNAAHLHVVPFQATIRIRLPTTRPFILKRSGQAWGEALAAAGSPLARHPPAEVAQAWRASCARLLASGGAQAGAAFPLRRQRPTSCCLSFADPPASLGTANMKGGGSVLVPGSYFSP